MEVYRQQSISKAARLLEMTQPAVSQHIASLEVQLGRPLFDRHARGVRATVIADDLAAGLGATLDQAEAALAEARARSTQLSGVVHIAGPAEYMAEIIAPQLGDVLAAGLGLRLYTGGKDMLYSMLLEDRVDLAFTASKPEDPRLAFEQVGHERLVAVATPHIVTQIASFRSLADAFEEVPHLAYDLDRPLLRSWLEANGLSLPAQMPVGTVADLRMVRALLCRNAGWSVLPHYLCEHLIKQQTLALIPPPIRSPENAFFLVWAKSALRNPRVALARNILLRNCWSSET